MQSVQQTANVTRRFTFPLVDLIKFFFCLCVIAVHTKLLSFSTTATFIIYNGLFEFAIPFFFIASGYFLGGKLGRTEDKKSVVFAFCKRLLLPYCVFSVINIVERVAGMIAVGTAVKDIVINVVQAVLFYPYGALWFVWACIIGSLLLIPFLKRGKLDLALVIGCFLYVFALLCNSYYGIVQNEALKHLIDLYLEYFVSPRNGLFVGFVYLAIGIKCSEKKPEYYAGGDVVRRTVLLLIGLYVLHWVEAVLLDRYVVPADDGHYGVMLLFVTPLIFTLSIGLSVRIVQKNASAFGNTILFRNLSTGMYFLHRAILIIVAHFIKNSILCFFIVASASAIICLIAYRFPKSIVCKLLK